MTLYQQIRADQLADQVTQPIGKPPVPEATPTSLPEVLEQLVRLHQVMGEVEHRLQEQIQVVEQALKRQ